MLIKGFGTAFKESLLLTVLLLLLSREWDLAFKHPVAMAHFVKKTVPAMT